MSSQWKLVPVEPTETMVIHGFESAPNVCFTDYKVWDAYQEMSGCQQAAFRAKLCWAAMIAAAPAPDTHIAVLEESAGVEFGIDGRSVHVSQEAYSIFLAREAAGLEKIAALQQRLTAADERNDTATSLIQRIVANFDTEIECNEDVEPNDLEHDQVLSDMRAFLNPKSDDWLMNPCKQGHHDVGAAGGVAQCYTCAEKIMAASTQEAFEQWNATHPAT